MDIQAVGALSSLLLCVCLGLRPKRFNVKQANEFVRATAKAMEILVVIVPEFRPLPTAYAYKRRIVIKAITNPVRLASALHELGHFATHQANLDQGWSRIEFERAAWAWARENSPYWDAVMDADEAYSLGTYEGPDGYQADYQPTV